MKVIRNNLVLVSRRKFSMTKMITLLILAAYGKIIITSRIFQREVTETKQASYKALNRSLMLLLHAF